MSRSLGCVVATVLLAGCARGGCDPAPSPEAVMSRGDHEVRLVVEVADSPDERARGLMGRERLAADRGMAFVFDDPATDGFWMKNTLIPLSIAFWDPRGRIVAILDMDPCTSHPCPTYGPDVPYVGALEANRGYFDAHDVQLGDRVRVEAHGCI